MRELTKMEVDQVAGGDAPGLAPNPGSPSPNGNMVAINSAQVIHNGQAVAIKRKVENAPPWCRGCLATSPVKITWVDTEISRRA